MDRIHIKSVSWGANRKVVTFVLTIMFSLITSCTVVSGYTARITYDFKVNERDERVLFESGAEKAAATVSSLLEKHIGDVERAHFVEFKDPKKIKIYIFTDKTRFSRYAFSRSDVFGAANANEIFISLEKIRERSLTEQCKSKGCPETVGGILLHELSHVHLRQYLGNWRYVKNIPSWFLEGLATLVSRGAGAGLTTEAQERISIASGSHLLPEDSGVIIGKPGTTGDLIPGTFRFYRQSQIFVRHLQNKDSAAFQKILKAILAGELFRSVWEPNYGSKIEDLWADFQTGI